MSLIAIALVTNIVDGVWISDCEEPCPDVLANLESGLEHSSITALDREGNQIVVVNYSVGADVRVPWTPFATFRPAMLGTIHDYPRVGTDLVVGVTRGLDELDKVDAPIKALIVFGDGHDTNDHAAVDALTALRRRAIDAHVMPFAIVYKSVVSSEGDVVHVLVHGPHLATVNSAAGITEQLDRVAAELIAMGAKRAADIYGATLAVRAAVARLFR